jgi:hypothetical protein
MHTASCALLWSVHQLGGGYLPISELAFRTNPRMLAPCVACKWQQQQWQRMCRALAHAGETCGGHVRSGHAKRLAVCPTDMWQGTCERRSAEYGAGPAAAVHLPTQIAKMLINKQAPGCLQSCLHRASLGPGLAG